MRIAVLDDNSNIGEYLRTALTLSGHSASVFLTAPSLFEILFPNETPISPLPYDCLLIDIFLSEDYSGIDVCRRIQERIAPDRLFTIFMTAAAPALAKPLLSEMPGAPVLYKPFRISHLLRLLAAFRDVGSV